MEDLQQILLNRMKDVESITEVSTFPLAIGWWFLGFFIILILAIVFLSEYKKAQYRKSWRFSIKQEVENLLNNFQENNAKKIIGELNELIKRVGIQIYGRNEVASLEGENWLKWLSARDPKNFNWAKKGKILILYPYMPDDKISLQKKDLEIIANAFIDWLK